MEKLEYMFTMEELNHEYMNYMKAGNVEVISYELEMINVPLDAFESIERMTQDDTCCIKSGYVLGGPRGGYNFIFHKRLESAHRINSEKEAVTFLEYLENQELTSWRYMGYRTFIRLVTKVNGEFDPYENFVQSNNVNLQRKNIEWVFFEGEGSSHE